MKKLIIKEDKSDNKHHALFSVPCYEPWYNMIIRPNGRVGPCCMFDFSGEYCHDKSLKEIWFGNYFNKVRESLLKKELPSYCSNCNPSQIVNNERIRKELDYLSIRGKNNGTNGKGNSKKYNSVAKRR